MLILLISLILAYLISSISSAIIVSKIFNLPDPRTQGSKNPGATNVLRIGGKKAAAYVFLGDALKGFIPVLIARLLSIEGFALGLVAWVAVLGHVFPIYYQFKGGKGVATTIGSLFALAPLLGVLFIGTWLIMAKLFRYSSLSALTAVVLTPFFSLLFEDFALLLPVCLITLTLLLTHHENIQRLLKGTESTIK